MLSVRVSPLLPPLTNLSLAETGATRYSANIGTPPGTNWGCFRFRVDMNIWFYLPSATLFRSMRQYTALPIRPIVIPPRGWSTSLYGLANAPPGNDHLIMTPKLLCAH